MRLGPSAQRRLAVALADVLGEGDALSAEVASFVAAYVTRAPWLAGLGLRAAVWALTWLPALVVGVPLPVDLLGPARRARYLARCAGSRVYVVREGFYLLKAIALMGWAEQPEVRARLGLPPVKAGRS